MSSCVAAPTTSPSPPARCAAAWTATGHLGYAAQTDLNDFGADVFTAPSGNGFQPLQPPIDTPEASLMIGLPLPGSASSAATSSCSGVGGHGSAHCRDRCRPLTGCGRESGRGSARAVPGQRCSPPSPCCSGSLAYGVDLSGVRAIRAMPWQPGDVAAQAAAAPRRSDQTARRHLQIPAITVAGDDVRVKTPTFSAFAVVTGPLVPGEGLSYQPQYVVATWTVHIWDVKGHIPLSAADFDNIDHVGTEFHLQPPQGTTMPQVGLDGRAGHLQLRAVVPIGEDLFRWAPNGNNIVAKWDNQVEND